MARPRFGKDKDEATETPPKPASNDKVEKAVDDLLGEESKGPSLADVMDTVKATAEAVGGLATRIADVEARVTTGTPTYTPIDHDGAKAPARDRSVAVMETETRDGTAVSKSITRKVLSTARGAPMTEGMMQRNGRPKFGIGDRIRINPAIQPEGAFKWEDKQRSRADGRGVEKYRVATDEPRFWRDILADSSGDGTGEVLEVMYLSDKTAQYKYRCLVPGHSTSDGGTGLWEYELLPA